MKNLKYHAQEFRFYLLGTVLQIQNFYQRSDRPDQIGALEIPPEWFVDYGRDGNEHES